MDDDLGQTRVVVHHGDPDRVAIILPGRGYSPDFPVLYYTRALLLARGWTVREVRWGRLPADPASWPGQVRRAASAVLDLPGPAGQRLVVGKSLGTHALPIAVTHDLPGIWLTPLLHDAAQVQALRRASAPTLVVSSVAALTRTGPTKPLGNCPAWAGRRPVAGGSSSSLPDWTTAWRSPVTRGRRWRLCQP